MYKKKNVFFIIARIVVLFIMGLIVAAIIALSQINLDTLRGDIINILKDATGLPVQIDGGVSWKFSLRPQIELNEVRVANAEWAKHKDAFSAEKIDVTLNLISLFRDRPTIQNIKIYNASLCIEKNEKGMYSLQPENKQVKETKELMKYPFEDFGFSGVEVKNLELDFLGNVYHLNGFQVRYFPRNESREYSGWVKSNKSVFPFIFSFSEYNAERKVYPLKIAFSTGSDALIANVALEGTSKMPIDFIIKGDIPNIASVGEIFNLKIPKMPLIKVYVAGGFDRKKLTLRSSSIKVQNSNLNLSGDIDWAKNKPLINLNLDSTFIELSELFPNLYSKEFIKPNRELNVFKDIPLFGNVFLQFDLNLHTMLDKLVVFRDFSIDDIDLYVNLKDGQARVDGTTVIGNGDIKVGGNVYIESDGNMFVKLGGIGRNIFVGNILSQLRLEDIISDLPVNFETYLEASGKDLSEWMKSISGPVKIYSADSGYAHSALVAKMYGTDFLTTLRHSIQDLFRTEKKYNQIKISCVALNTKLRNGAFETQNGVAVETNAINIRFAGNLDLGNENLKLSLATVPVRGLKLSLTGNLVNSMEFTGSLAEPDIKISGTAVAGKVASATGLGLLLAPFTGGIGLVAGAGVGLLAGDLIENWLADDHPCETALEKGSVDYVNDPEWLRTPLEDLVNEILNN